ncbi:hypothetical protein BH10PSE14_BH10PSE14_06400 [soil metagenome]
MRDDCPISRNLEVKQGLFFSACEKRGLSIAAMAAAADMSASTLGSYRPSSKRVPSLMPLTVFVKLAREVPADLMNILIEDSHHHLTAIDPGTANWLGLGMRAARFASKVCEFQATGNRIDHREDAELREDMLIIISEGNGAVAGNG